jgi:hypothetical protein
MLPNLPDLVITNVNVQGSAYTIGERGGYPEKAVGVALTVMNRGTVGIPRESSFSIGVHHDGECKPKLPDCGTDYSSATIACSANQGIFLATMTKTFHFSPSIQVNSPLAAGESRTIIGRLILPQCLQGETAQIQIYLVADDARSRIEESNESNNKSAVFGVTYY